ncbi:unnamed protein product [Zymoseptoria tritici ST99CH_1A5]|uniref:Uncharacterized protein n=3 Tax=Zymoseptoria tritici TaxID=1047171 RepID=A0A1X7S0H8_ZYMT9|nr:unnamed protein product [Zymoseptoria tritici ST99CH_3D7]SMY26674.1 unnamed protein product [Zymoseptoria tritici ST99CH_1A5]
MADDDAYSTQLMQLWTTGFDACHQLYEEDKLDACFEQVQRELVDQSMPLYHRMRFLLLFAACSDDWYEADDAIARCENIWQSTRSYHTPGADERVDDGLYEVRQLLDTMRRDLDLKPRVLIDREVEEENEDVDMAEDSEEEAEEEEDEEVDEEEEYDEDDFTAPVSVKSGLEILPKALDPQGSVPSESKPPILPELKARSTSGFDAVFNHWKELENAESADDSGRIGNKSKKPFRSIGVPKDQVIVEEKGAMEGKAGVEEDEREVKIEPEADKTEREVEIEKMHRVSEMPLRSANIRVPKRE